MNIEDRRCNAVWVFKELEIGDVYTICGSYVYMKTAQATRNDFDTNMVCLNDGNLSWTAPDRVVEKLNAMVVIE